MHWGGEGGQKCIYIPGVLNWKTNIYKKGKVIPLHSWAGPEGLRSLRLKEFLDIGT